jgi:molybdopterin converting factor subunit 1
MKLEIILFAIYKERAKASSIYIELMTDSTVGQLISKIKNEYPELAAPETEIVVAVNSEYAEYDLQLNPNDEICLIPPVSGG